jgi:hypothetical protein
MQLELGQRRTRPEFAIGLMHECEQRFGHGIFRVSEAEETRRGPLA